MIPRTGSTPIGLAGAFTMPLTAVSQQASMPHSTAAQFGASAAKSSSLWSPPVSPITGGNVSAFWRTSKPEDTETTEAVLASTQKEAAPEAGSFSEMLTTSAVIAGALLLVAGIISFAGLFRKKPQAGKAAEPGIHERETVPFDTAAHASGEDRPTMAATPDAMRRQGATPATSHSKTPSFGARIGGEHVPGVSIIPPPDPSGPHGGRGIK